MATGFQREVMVVMPGIYPVHRSLTRPVSGDSGCLSDGESASFVEATTVVGHDNHGSLSALVGSVGRLAARLWRFPRAQVADCSGPFPFGVSHGAWVIGDVACASAATSSLAADLRLASLRRQPSACGLSLYRGPIGKTPCCGSPPLRDVPLALHFRDPGHPHLNGVVIGNCTPRLRVV